MSRQTWIATPLDQEGPLTLGEVCRACDLQADYVIDMVQVGVVEPIEGRQPAEWRFHPHAIVRVRRALRLRRDLAVDLGGAALVLDLIEEVRELRQRVQALEGEPPIR